ncbi:MAG: type II toxin-antitoxin system HigB family toxin [Pseudomonadota bacterium]
MRVYSKSTLRDFWERHPDAEQPLKTWYAMAKAAEWNSPAEVKQRYADVSIVHNNRLIFNIKGNDYRVVAAVHYDKQRVFVRFVGTHREYDRIDAETI